MMITFTGGEPLLRRDLEEIVAEVARAVPRTYLTLITHGGMLTLERAQALWDAGLVQVNISLDYLDERHDAARKIPGLAAKILRLAPAMADRGMTVRFNTVIKNDNLDDILPIVRHAASIGAGVNLSLYTDFKNGNTEHLVREGQFERVDALELALAHEMLRVAVLEVGVEREIHACADGGRVADDRQDVVEVVVLDDGIEPDGHSAIGHRGREAEDLRGETGDLPGGIVTLVEVVERDVDLHEPRIPEGLRALEGEPPAGGA